MIRKLERKDKENWIKLYCGYAKFYKVAMNQEILDTLWEWIHNETIFGSDGRDLNPFCAQNNPKSLKSDL